MSIELTDRDQAMLDGAMGTAVQMAMRILLTMANVYGAHRLLDIESAHIDGCLYHGFSGLEFARRLVAGGAKVVVPTTLNVGAVDLIHPNYFQGSDEDGRYAQELMHAYVQMGCQPVFTCAPYQATQRPAKGTQIAWAESNAIVRVARSALSAVRNCDQDLTAKISVRLPGIM